MLFELLNQSVTMIEFAIWAIAILVSLTFHEFAHAWTANYLGDDTAKHSGRLTLNPIAHLDPIGTMMILLARIGWAKPVPINPSRFKNQHVGEILVSIAGPFANLFLALVFSLVYRLLPDANIIFKGFISILVTFNVTFMLFNLLPIPPLDGSHLLTIFVKNPRTLAIIQTYSLFLLLFLVFFIFPYILFPAVEFITGILLR